MPRAVGTIDLAMGIPGERALERDARLAPLLRDAASRAALGRPQGKRPADAGSADPIDWVIREMDRFGVAQGNARVLADHVGSKDLPRRRVRDDDPLAIEHEHRQTGVLDQVAHAFWRELNAFA